MTTLRRPAGLTYFELLTVLTILSVMAMVATPMLTGQVESARVTITWSTMQEIRRAINEHYYDANFQSLPYPLDTSRVGHPQLVYLYVNPSTFALTSEAGTIDWTFDPRTQRGWNGPYLTNNGIYQFDLEANFSNLYGEEGDAVPLDGWGQPIVLQQPQALGSSDSAHSRRYARLVSAGANGVIDTPPSEVIPTETQMGDDLVAPLMVSP